jgi:spore coat protein A
MPLDRKVLWTITIAMLMLGGCNGDTTTTLTTIVQQPVAGQRAPLDPNTLQQFATPFVEIPIAATDPANPTTYTVNVRQGTWDFGLRNMDGSQIIDSMTGKPIVTKTWGYDVNGVFLGIYGPTVEATKGTALTFNYINNLRDEVNRTKGTGPYLTKHLLAVDPTIDGANGGEPECRIVTHLHGGDVDYTSDGYPNAWVTNDPAVQAKWAKADDLVNMVPGRPATNRLNPYIYPNNQDATTLWFHDHSMGITRLNAYAGVAAFYLIRDPAVEGTAGTALADLTASANRRANPVVPTLQSDEFDLPVVIQDKDFTVDGALVFPTFNNMGAYTYTVLHDANGNVEQSIRPEMFGNVVTVNGKAWPYKDVKEQVYRFRLLNGSDSRVYNLWLQDADSGEIITPALASAAATAAGNPGLTWPVMQVGADQGYINAAVDVATGPADGGLLLAPAERADIVIDFAHPVFRNNGKGRNIVLRNDAPAPFSGLFGPANEDPTTLDAKTTGKVMMFRVSSTIGTPSPLFASAGPATSLRTAVVPFTSLGAPTRVAGARLVDLQERKDPVFVVLDPTTGTVSNRTMLLLNGLRFGDPITERPEQGGTEEWIMINTTPDVHPMHMHLTKMQVIEKGYINLGGSPYVRAEGGAMPQLPATAVFVPNADPRLNPAANTAPSNSVYRVSPSESLVYKDTVKVPPAQTPYDAFTDVVNPGYMRVRVQFNRLGTYLWHCHILSHEEFDMMRPLTVMPAGQGN